MSVRLATSIAASVAVWTVLTATVSALPLQALVRVVAPARLPTSAAVGQLSYQSGILTVVNLVNLDVPATASIAVDKNVGTATWSAGSNTMTFDCATLRSVPFGSLATNAEYLGGLAFVGDRLPAEAKLLKRTTYQGHEVDLYFFRQDKDHFGEVFYSPLYAFPLKIDSYDASKDERTVIQIENIH